MEIFIMENDNLLITITDEQGNDSDCILMDSMEYEDRTYVFLVPAEQAEMEEQDVIIMEFTEENGEVILNPVENEVLLDELFNEYIALVENGEE